MKVVIAGGTGWIGTALGTSLVSDGHEVAILTRSPKAGSTGRQVQWDGRSPGPWAAEIDDADGIVNLCGESIGGGRWTAARKKNLLRSRIEPTSLLVQALSAAPSRSRVLVNASAVGYYGDRGDEPLTEVEGPGLDFLAQLVVQWETATRPAEAAGVRVALMRNSVVFGPGGGALRQLALPFRFFVGGPIGRPGAWFPWIHLDDVIGLFRRALVDDQLAGPLNVAAGSATMEEIARGIGRALNRPSWLPAPQLGLRLLLGELGEALTVSQRVVPERALGLGYQFREPGLTRALERSLAR